jgi:uncharacterized protein (TIGR02996 family)
MTTVTADPVAQAFLRDICANPEDDTPRLIYADWLDERGEEARAEFIRVQCEMYQREIVQGRRWLKGHVRAHELSRELEAAVWSGLPESMRPMIWRRGFVDEVSCSWGDWVCHGPSVCARQPVTRLRLPESDPVMKWLGPYEGSRNQRSPWWEWNIHQIQDVVHGGDKDDQKLITDLSEWLDRRLHRLLFQTRESALETLVWASIDWARAQNDLPELFRDKFGLKSRARNGLPELARKEGIMP